MFGFDDYGVEYVTDKRPIVCRKLNILHGHEYPGGFAAPVSPLAASSLRSKACCIGTTTRLQNTRNRRMREKHRLLGLGCLSELPSLHAAEQVEPQFASIEMAREGNFKIRNHKIINGEIY